MSAAKKMKDDLTLEDIKDMYYISVAEICKRTTYARRSVETAIQRGDLKSEKKNNGKRVVKVSDFVQWWRSLDT